MGGTYKPLWYLLALGAAVILDLVLLRAYRADKREHASEDAASNGQAGHEEARSGGLVLLLISGALLLLVHILIQGHDFGSPVGRGLLLLAALLPVSLAVWLLETRRDTSAAGDLFRRAADWLRIDPNLLWCYPLAPTLALVAWFAAGDGPQMRDPVLAPVLWFAALALVLVPSLGKKWRSPLALPQGRREWTIIIGLVLLGLFLRAFRMDQIPWLLTGDEAGVGIDSVEIVRGRWNNPFVTGWYSFPSLFFFIPAASIQLFGPSILALRLPSALAGAITVFLLYGYAREVFGQRTALFAAAFLSVSHFHILFSRLGLNNIWDPLFYVLVAALFWRAWRKGPPALYAWSGVALGLSLYFYVSSRALPVLIMVWLLVAFLRDRSAVRRRLPGLVTMLIAFTAAALPILLFFSRHPVHFTAPLFRVSTINDWGGVLGSGEGLSLIGSLLDQLRIASLAFTSIGLTQFYNPGRPILMPIAATLFVLGLILMLVRIRKLRYVWLGLWLLTALAASTLSHGGPAAQRYIHVAPAAALLVSLPLNASFRWTRGISNLTQGRMAIITSTILVLLAFQSLSFYFLDYTPSRRFGDPNTEAANLMAEHLTEWPPGTEVKFLTSHISFRSHGTVQYLAPHIDGEDLIEVLDPMEVEIDPTTPTVFIAPPDRAQELQVLHDLYPNGRSERLSSVHGGTLLVTYEITPK